MSAVDIEFPAQSAVEISWQELSTEAIACFVVPDPEKKSKPKEEIFATENNSGPSESPEALAYQKGLEEGCQKGKSETEQQFQEQIKKLTDENAQLKEKQNEFATKIVENITQEKIKFNTTFEEDIKSIIEHVVKTILQTELSQQPDKLQHAIEDALRSLTKDRSAILYVNPELQPKLVPLFENKGITIESDAQLKLFDFYILQDHSRLSGELETRIKQSIESVYT